MGGRGAPGGGARFYLQCRAGPRASRVGSSQTRAANNTLMESWVSWANSAGGGAPVDALVLLAVLLLASQGCGRSFFRQAASLLAGMDILTADTRWPLAYGNSLKAQPGLIVTSAVLGEVSAEVQA